MRLRELISKVYSSSIFKIVIKIIAGLATALGVISGGLFLYNNMMATKKQSGEYEEEMEIED